MPNYLKSFMTVGLSALLLSGCANDSLNEKTALELVKERYGKITVRKSVAICPESKKKYKVNVGAFQTHPCGNYNLKDSYQKIFVDKYNLIKFEDFSFVACRMGWCGEPEKIKIRAGINEDELASIGGSDFMTFISDTKEPKISIKMYDWEVSEIIDIRQLEDGSILPDTSCSAKVEYKIKRFNFAPWGKEYLEKIEQPSETYSACFVKYEDGWRFSEDE